MTSCPRCGTGNPVPASFCMSCGSRLRSLAPRGETRKSVTVVFCDVAGSTEMGERLDPEALRQVMSRYFELTRAALERHGGTVEKFIGDAVMAVFGLPRSHEDDALRAVRAADEMRDAVRRLGAQLRADFGVELSVRIGINTGEVIAGDPTAGQALVTGDAVNVAARLEQTAAAGEVLMGTATYRLVRDFVTAERTSPLALKGKAESVTAFRLASVTGPSTHPRRRRTEGSLVGRHQELHRLDEALSVATRSRACQAVTVLAPPGTGKSRLVEEFVSALPHGVQSLRGRCLPYGEGITYFPVGQIIRGAAGLADFEPPDEARRRVRALLDDDEHSDLVANRMLQLLGIGDATSPEDTLWAVRRFVEALARERPLVLVLDDLHWAEPTLLDLLEHITEFSRGAALLLVCTARPELLDLRPGWGSTGQNTWVLRLDPLSGDECERLLANLLGDSAVPAEVRDRVVQAAGGTPLFVEEMVAMMIDDGVLTRTVDGWRPAADLASIGPPPTISALLAARLDGLSEEERRILDAGAVIGQEFVMDAIRALVPEELRPAAFTHLMAMVRKELLRPDRSTVPGEDAFRFRHELMRDAAYEALPKQVRADLHELVATWMQRIAGDRIAEQEEIVGYHLEQAHRYRTELRPNDPDAVALAHRAGRALSASGGRAYARGDMRASAKLLGRAVRLLPPEDVDRLEQLPRLAAALTETGRSDEAEDVLRQGVTIASRLQDERLQARLALALVDHEDSAGRPDPPEWAARCEAEASAALTVFERVGDVVGQADAQRALGDAAWDRGRAARAVEHWQRSEELSRSCGDVSAAAHRRAWYLIAHYFGQTRASEVLHLAEEALDDVGDVPAARSEVLWVVSGARAMLGDGPGADQAFQESARIEKALGRAWTGAHFGAQVQAEVLHLSGRPHEEVDVLRRGAAEYESMTNQPNVLLLARLAEALAGLGEDDAALEAARRARQIDGFFHVPQALNAEALVLARRGDRAGALERAHQSLEMLQESDFYWLTAGPFMALAAVHQLTGDRPAAHRAATEALERYEHKQIKHLAAQARRAVESTAD